MKALVEFKVGTYEGTLEVACYDVDSDRVIEARAELELTRKAGAPLPVGERRFRVVRREASSARARCLACDHAQELATIGATPVQAMIIGVVLGLALVANPVPIEDSFCESHAVYLHRIKKETRGFRPNG